MAKKPERIQVDLAPDKVIEIEKIRKEQADHSKRVWSRAQLVDTLLEMGLKRWLRIY